MKNSLVKPGRKPAPKCDREATVTEMVRTFDALKSGEELFEEKLKALQLRYETEKKALEATYAPDLARMTRVAGGLAAKLKADHGSVHDIPAWLGGGKVVVTGTGEKRGASLEFIDRAAYWGPLAALNEQQDDLRNIQGCLQPCGTCEIGEMEGTALR